MYNNLISKPIISENQIILLKKCKNASKTNEKIKILIKSKEIKTEKIITILKNIFYNFKKKEKLIKMNRLDLQNYNKCPFPIIELSKNKTSSIEDTRQNYVN